MGLVSRAVYLTNQTAEDAGRSLFADLGGTTVEIDDDIFMATLPTQEARDWFVMANAPQRANYRAAHRKSTAEYRAAVIQNIKGKLMGEPLTDMKESLAGTRKVDITHVRSGLMNYVSRNCEYGTDKYERSNYLRPVTPEGYTGVPTKLDWERFRQYLRAVVSHAFKTLDAMELHQSMDPRLEDSKGMQTAAYAVDTDVTPGAKVGASMLPHIGGAAASLNMALQQAIACGLLPEDPGTPWRK